MASVQYQVLYKYAHPITKKAVTNTTSAEYKEFTKGYPTGGVSSDDLGQENRSTNEKFDMLFLYKGLYNITTIFPAGVVTGDAQIATERFERCKGEAWFTASVHTSLQSALKAAEPIAKSMGKANVRVVKNVPLDIAVTMG